MCEAAGCQKVDRTSHMLVAGQAYVFLGDVLGNNKKHPLYEGLSV